MGRKYNIIQQIGVNTKNWMHSVQDKDYWRAFVEGALNLRVS